MAGIPTAPMATLTAPMPPRITCARVGAPIVIKADGLAAGKGVTVAETLDEALAAVEACFLRRFWRGRRLGGG